MKKDHIIYLALLILFTVNTGFSKLPEPQSGPKIAFDTRVYDFGTIKRHADGTCSFMFTNKGDAPLMITKVTAACGCTVPQYPREPILPGKSAEIKVKYNTKTVGAFTKTISVSTNDPGNSTVVLTIKGNVTR